MISARPRPECECGPLARRVAGALVLAVATALAGCSPYATYPSVETRAASALARPTFEPVPTVMAVAIDYARDNYLPGRELPVNLPAGANWEVYDRVFEKLENGAKPMTVSGEPAIHIKEVRTRAFEAQVDLIYPRTDGLNQLVTISMHREMFKDWRVKTARLWQIRSVEAPASNYVAPTAAELVKNKKEVGPGGERVTLQTTEQRPE